MTMHFLFCRILPDPMVYRYVPLLKVESELGLYWVYAVLDKPYDTNVVSMYVSVSSLVCHCGSYMSLGSQ